MENRSTDTNEILPSTYTRRRKVIDLENDIPISPSGLPESPERDLVDTFHIVLRAEGNSLRYLVLDISNTYSRCVYSFGFLPYFSTKYIIHDIANYLLYRSDLVGKKKKYANETVGWN